MRYRLLAFAALLILGSVPAVPAVAQTDCGEDLGCFADQSASCGPAFVNYTLELDLAPLVGLQQGFVTSTTDALSVQPDPAGSERCQLDLTVAKSTASLSDDAAQELKDKGTTQEQIEAMRQSMADSAGSTEGRGGTCLFAVDDLQAMLQRWQAGFFSTNDWAPATCSGSYFS